MVVNRCLHATFEDGSGPVGLKAATTRPHGVLLSRPETGAAPAVANASERDQPGGCQQYVMLYIRSSASRSSWREIRCDLTPAFRPGCCAGLVRRARPQRLAHPDALARTAAMRSSATWPRHPAVRAAQATRSCRWLRRHGQHVVLRLQQHVFHIVRSHPVRCHRSR